jgi:hypothetical protein
VGSVLTRRVAVTPTIGTDAYTAGDVVGGLLTFAVGTAFGGGGRIVKVLLIDAANQKEGYTLYLFGQAPSTIADDAAYEPTAADLAELADRVTIEAGDYTTVNGTAVAILGGHEDKAMAIPVKLYDGNVYGYLVAGDTPDYAAATDLTLILELRVD